LFKELRNKFLILNLVIISIMMLISFTSIYLITYNNVHSDIEMELRKISDSNKRTNEYQNDGPKELRPNFDNKEAPPERSVSFTVITDARGVITHSSSLFEMDSEFYQTSKDEALSRKADTGNFKLDGNYWAFIKKPSPEGHRIVFLDITSRQAILTKLIYTFLMVAFVMIIAIFFISRFFANKSIKPIKEAFNRQKQFIGDASHELKTPLAVISTNVDVLLSNREDTIDSQSKWLHYIKSEVERMSKLTNDLLYLTQMDYSDVKMIFSDFNLSETVEDVILTMEAVIFENNITLEYNIEPALTTHGSSEQLKQVVMILLDNALKYTNLNGKVELSLKKVHNNILLSITNTGKGIPEQHIGKIFDRFYRIDKSRSRNSGGYGLGLSIAKAIVEQHGGRVYARSVPDNYTTFTVELPLVS
jgi:two-component system, OmpR family, sensor histidine kinase CiaH